MTKIRYLLIGLSALAAVSLSVYWITSVRSFSIALFVALAYFIVNTFYLAISRPAVRASELLTRASTGLAIASLELQHQAHEAQAREVEAERRRLEEAQHNQYKLQVAKDMLQHLRSKLALDHEDGPKVPQITLQRDPDGRVPSLPPAVSPAVPSSAEGARLANGGEPRPRPPQPVAQVAATPSTVLN